MFQRILLAWDGSRGRAARVRRRDRRHPPLRRRARRRLDRLLPGARRDRRRPRGDRRRRPPLPRRRPSTRSTTAPSAPASTSSTRSSTATRPPRALLDYAHEHGFDLIVCGHHHSRRAGRLLLTRRHPGPDRSGTRPGARRQRRRAMSRSHARSREAGRRSSAMPTLDSRELAAIFVGGAIGAVLRVWLGQHFSPGRGRAGRGRSSRSTSAARSRSAYFATRLQERLPQSTYRRPLLGTGFCGAYTTFSTMQVEILKMVEARPLRPRRRLRAREHRRRLRRDLARRPRSCDATRVIA